VSATRASRAWKAITRNLLLKLVALGLALLVYLSVYLDREHEANIRVPLLVSKVPSGRVIVGEVPRRATVRVRARGRLLAEMKLTGQRDRGVYVNVELEPGENSVDRGLFREDVVVPLGLDLQPLDVVRPDRVAFHLDELVEREVPVAPRFVGEPPRGYTLSGAVSIQPPRVTISGPRTQVSQVDEIPTVAIDVSKHNTPFAEVVGLHLPSQFEVSPSEVEVRADIEPTGRYVLEQVPVIVRNLRRHRSSVEPPTGAVELWGPESQLAKIRALQEGGQPTGVMIVLDAQGLGPGAREVAPLVELAGQLRLVSVTPARFLLRIGAAEAPR